MIFLLELLLPIAPLSAVWCIVLKRLASVPVSWSWEARRWCQGIKEKHVKPNMPGPASTDGNWTHHDSKATYQQP